ncbi:MAG TPA: bifunctional phosphopantothenoylcysteine decarboxylase/phosphopantothenate--cysteine ligase CoaBC [Terriglobia bacterium]|nr:bifunctional phosphopantothenoylcysteine decarboxylase/phosphopantothenate--cysteine ligase CoaBC [Terriglobia bacterium]
MRIALGVTGGIAAYKAAEVLRLLQDRDLDVQVIMTDSARKFITPLTFASLSGHKVITGLLEGSEPNFESSIEHIAVAQGIGALVIAPATADVLARMAQGITNDFLTALYLATQAPVVVAPSMNVNMWEHAATRANLATLRERGVIVVEPDAGYLACGMTGAGRLRDPEDIAQAVFHALGLTDDMKGETLLVTAGPTREPLDAVRHLANRSSGKMGYALAEAGRRRGARVLLVSGPTHLDAPTGTAFERVETADEMAEAVMKKLDEASVIVMAAAVADYQAESIAPGKIKKSNGSLTLRLKPTRDILSEIAARRRPGQFVAGFAAETENVVENAAAKLAAKRLDMMVANDVTRDGAGFDADTNIVTLLFPDGRRKHLEKASKLAIACQVLDEIVALRKTQAEEPGFGVLGHGLGIHE